MKKKELNKKYTCMVCDIVKKCILEDDEDIKNRIKMCQDVALIYFPNIDEKILEEIILLSSNVIDAMFTARKIKELLKGLK